MTCDTLLTLRGTWGFYLKHHVHQSLPLRLIECALHNVLLEHGELPGVLSFDVYLDLGHCPDTQGYLGLLPEPFYPTQGFLKLSQLHNDLFHICTKIHMLKILRLSLVRLIRF